MLAVYGLPVGLVACGFLIDRLGYPQTMTAATTLGLILTVLIGLRWRASIWQRRRGPASV
jgi:hypothetical protein